MQRYRLHHFEFRKKSSLGAKKVESIKYLVASEIEKYLEIENILSFDNKFQLDYSHVKVETEEDAKVMALRLRNYLKIGLESVSSAVELLENLGIKIIEVEVDPKFSGTCTIVSGIPVIVVNKLMTPERKRMTIFHELGHILIHFVEGADKERLCNIFASEMLIPSQKLMEIVGVSRNKISFYELQAIQKQYGISIDDLMAKAANLNIIPKSKYRTYHKKKNALPKYKEAVEKSIFNDESSSRFKRLVYRALASDMISFSKAAGLLDCSVNEVRKNLSGYFN